jgi:hypothetical protein
MWNSCLERLRAARDGAADGTDTVSSQNVRGNLVGFDFRFTAKIGRDLPEGFDQIISDTAHRGSPLMLSTAARIAFR